MNLRKFKVGTFNLYNLAAPERVFYTRESYTMEEYGKKRDWIAQQLNRMQVDLVGFQEVVHEDALKDVLKGSNFCRGLCHVTTAAFDDAPGVALASQFPILEYRVIRGFPAESALNIDGINIPVMYFTRPILSARVRLTDNIQCTVFVVHFKSQLPMIPEGVDPNDPVERAKGRTRSLIVRSMEAIAFRTILMTALQNRDSPVIVLGDLNDSGLAVTSQIISGEMPGREQDAEQQRKLSDILLYSVKDIQARQSYGDYYYTYIYNGHYGTLDHIMVSQEFVAQNPNRLGRVSYVNVLNDHLIDEVLSSEKVPRWQSDHGQVVATIELEQGEDFSTLPPLTRTHHSNPLRVEHFQVPDSAETPPTNSAPADQEIGG